MRTDVVREKYLKFFVKKGHREIPAAPLVLENDPTTLFTSAGMQPLVPYLKGQKHPQGTRLVDSQPSIRLGDIDEVGDTSHTTLFEMLGNWSLGDYFKKEQLAWIWEFFTGELGLPEEKLWVSVFEGSDNVPRDTESFEIWKSLGVPNERIRFYGVEKNWWSLSGTPEAMSAGEIGGPDSEVFFDFGERWGFHEKSKWRDEPCHPNCNCGRFLEIGNSVFIQYQKKEDGSLQDLPQKNVDFGGGLERITAAVNGKQDIFQIDIFEPYIKKLEEITKAKYGESPEVDRSFRIIADHIRAACALIENGVVPGSKAQEYILRRLIRRSAVKMRTLVGKLSGELFAGFADSRTSKVLVEEVEKFSKTLDRGLREFEKFDDSQLNALNAFNLFQTYGFPFEITNELSLQRGKQLDKEEFDRIFEDHQKLSRATAEKMFKGGMADQGEETVRLHTVTHLIHAALRRVLGEDVSQKGSNITSERLRFDFTHPGKVTGKDLEKVENLVNEQVQKGLPVRVEEMSLEQAKDQGALAFFGQKYGERVKVYAIGDSQDWFSKEVCGGPHVANLGEIKGRVKIYKEEAAGSGIRRIYARILLDSHH